MINPSSRVMHAAVVLFSAMAIACGSEDPNIRTADWEEHFNQVNQSSASGDHGRAISVAESFLKKHPDNVDGHLMLGTALMEAGRAASDASRPARFKQAVEHFSRAVDLSNNPTLRFVALTSLVELYRREGLNDPEAALRYARMLIADRPDELSSYGFAISLLGEAKKYDEAVEVLKQAKAAMQQNADTVASYAGTVQSLAGFSPGFPPDLAVRLLAETVTLVDEALRQHGRTEGLLRAKGALLRTQANVETDEKRQRVLIEQSERAFEELDRLAK